MRVAAFEAIMRYVNTPDLAGFRILQLLAQSPVQSFPRTVRI
jgi:hypothetical protein